MARSHKYDYVFFDLDGTVTDSVPVIMDSFRQTYMAEFGMIPRTDEDIMSYIGRPLTDCFGMHDPRTAQRLLETYLRINIKALENGEVPYFPGAREDLLKLKKEGVPLGIVTSKLRSSAEITVADLRMEEIFDSFFYRDDSPEGKPSPEPLLRAAEREGISDMSRILYVGDAMPDLLCARAAGADFAFAGWSLMDKEEILSNNPQYVLQSFRDLSCIIQDSEL